MSHWKDSFHITNRTAEQFHDDCERLQPGVWELWQLPDGKQVVFRGAEHDTALDEYRRIGTRIRPPAEAAAVLCDHARLDEDGICRTCGADCRGAH